jgi:hypothetical protein
MYRIVWQMPNGFTGGGDYVLTLAAAQAWLADLAVRRPEMRHWIEAEPVG